ncbi:Predicted kinase from adenilate kinase family, FLAR-like protein [Xenorhabdus nematophila ATCC 19061]|uniref:Predicted kinase from adenilate kinase family, FLAR-like protein n=2 Tax=Xenorhabdus nematophila TaxID=628 RepID=D3VDQ0_XENNA|nr:Predicted kinase from adenilate kinase family, FLAR-like protein [Xenorhabdus nematophila ATCC 19061]CEK22844.1 Predicted kinase from adenilate kinase family, FLAR-like protein [Xenorhabdus nematophila AN6/1]
MVRFGECLAKLIIPNHRAAQISFIKRQHALVIGSPGAGKSTFARQLSQISSIPLFHLDKEYWQEGWIAPSAEEWQQKLSTLTNQSSWIIDGNYGSSLSQRLEKADTVIHLYIPTYICLFQAIIRITKWHGKQRPDMALGCYEKINFDFLRQIIKYRKYQFKKDKLLLDDFDGNYIQLTSRTAIKVFLQKIAHGNKHNH